MIRLSHGRRGGRGDRRMSRLNRRTAAAIAAAGIAGMAARACSLAPRVTVVNASGHQVVILLDTPDLFDFDIHIPPGRSATVRIEYIARSARIKLGRCVVFYAPDAVGPAIGQDYQRLDKHALRIQPDLSIDLVGPPYDTLASNSAEVAVGFPLQPSAKSCGPAQGSTTGLTTP